MYVKDIIITRIQPCTADAERIRFQAGFSRNISEVLPYMNAVLMDAIYNHKIPSLTFKKQFRIITLYEDKLAVSKAINETDAYEITDLIKGLVNEIYEKRKDIEPIYEMRQKPSAIEVYKYLPKINCRKCKEATCLAFASKFLMGEQKIQNCRPLYEEANKEKLETMEDFAQMLGY
ncbi:Metal-binding trascriptional regulator, contains putative Fe-S cluster and ArsR family DNA binding domain [Anaerovirgula multivorans]|uniref:Metal-binding trascriptional regulator, contains putative Fe-S cluster and ArsR family DNA binding domain n=1 Tax=Anaerovirgula multivorans TaxID=312168 RepID=A0A239AU83_9FIRM|nr:(Fe-S)-binding protein [Anaerovirgula multivorans]SNR99089.1 Metal-binding trascriptional regulator, contains putative Fe-S cluster and ArsR family DNA binding domain [Anaerovirgula multivorans]